MRVTSQLVHIVCASAFTSPGSELHDTEFDNTELLQTRVQPGLRKQLQRPAFSNLGQTVSSLQSELDKLIHHQNPSGSWDDQAVSLDNFKTLIEDQLLVFIQSEHDEDQAEYDVRREQHSSCGGSQRWEAGGDVFAAIAERIRWQAKHRACRASERAWLNYQAATDCASLCPSGGDVSSDHQILPAHANMATLVGVAQTRASTYETTDPPGTQACDLDQAQFEDHYCAWRSVLFYACSAEQSCDALTELTALRQSLLARSANRRAMWRSLTTMLCRVQHLQGSMDNDASTEVSDFTMTDNCSGVVLNDTTLVLSLETGPSACSDHMVGESTSILWPSTEDGNTCTEFLQDNYAWDPGEHVIPSVCRITCPQVSYTPYVVPSHCTNEPAQCQFYNYHRDACGTYDSGDFVAADVCCACGAPGVETSWKLPTSWTVSGTSQWSGSYSPDKVKIRSGNPWHSSPGWSRPQSLTYDAGQVVTIDGLATGHPSGWSGAAFKDFKFYRSDDGENWIEVFSGQGQNLVVNTRQEFEFPAASGRYWKLEMDDDWTYGYLAVQYTEFRST